MIWLATAKFWCYTNPHACKSTYVLCHVSVYSRVCVFSAYWLAQDRSTSQVWVPACTYVSSGVTGVLRADSLHVLRKPRLYGSTRFGELVKAELKRQPWKLLCWSNLSCVAALALWQKAACSLVVWWKWSLWKKTCVALCQHPRCINSGFIDVSRSMQLIRPLQNAWG